MQVTNSDNVQFYYQICGKDEDINSSPIDKLGVILNTNSFDTKELEEILERITNLDEQDYLREGIVCFKVGAIRAGIVFIWASAIRTLQNNCIKNGFKEVNEALLTINPKEKKLKRISDFERLRDKTSIDIAFRVGLLSKHQKSELEKHLDLRNYCGHPSEYYPEIQKVKAYLEDIIKIVFN